jgi:deoxyribodipyrimidine photo-lyase
MSTKALDSAALAWFRRDLRAHDAAALHAALTGHAAVHCAFVFDTEILDALPSRADRRVDFIWQSVAELKAALERLGGGLHVLHGRARDEIPRLAARLGVAAVYAARDYEPQALARDAEVEARLHARGIAFHTRKDHVIFELEEVRTAAGTPFSVFTPYRKAWLRKLDDFSLKPYPIARHAARLARTGSALPALEQLGFARAPMALPAGASGARTLFADFRRRIGDYAQKRDYPALKGPSYLSVHLRFGTVSIRELAGYAWRRPGAGAATWLSELCWRDFYFAILAWRPDVVDHAFRRELDALAWDDDARLWRAWCEGRTGYPLVDAAMRQLNQTGYLHNRLRMVAASFLVKDLGIDWRRGERYFAEKLNDYDLAANNGGWQWAASTGCDAQPWFRIFNPVTQSRRFDPRGAFIRRYLPELAAAAEHEIHLPRSPVVDHAAARARTLQRYAAVRGARERPRAPR